METMKINKKKLMKNEFKNNMLVALLLSFSFAFFEPFYIYLSNIQEFWYGPKILLPIICGVTIVVLVVIGVFLQILVVWGENVCRKFRTILAVISLGLFIQGNYLPNNIGMMDGAAIEWSKINKGSIYSLLLWVFIIVLSAWIVFKGQKAICNKLVYMISMSVISIEMVTLAVLLIFSNGFNDKNVYAVTDDGVNSYSDKNYVVFVLDDFDSRDFNSRINEDIQQTFEDFTYFPDTMSMYGHTDLSLPQIISGINYYNEETYGEYLRRAYDNSPLMNRMEEDKWNVGIYTESIVPAGNTAEYAINCIDVERKISSKRKFIKYNYQLVAYYCSPYMLKRFFWFYPDVIKDTQGIVSDEYKRFSWEESSFYSNMKVDVCIDKPVFRFYHLKGMHGPYDTNEELNKVDYVVGAEEAFWGNMLLIGDFLEQLKEKNIYDNTAIIIMSDHGESADITGEWKQNPIFIVKGYGEKHDFTISDNRISYADIQDIFLGVMDGQSAENATNILEKDAERIFLRYDFDMNESVKKEGSYFRPIYQYTSKGEAKNFDAFEKTDIKYSHK